MLINTFIHLHINSICGKKIKKEFRYICTTRINIILLWICELYINPCCALISDVFFILFYLLVDLCIDLSPWCAFSLYTSVPQCTIQGSSVKWNAAWVTILRTNTCPRARPLQPGRKEGWGEGKPGEGRRHGEASENLWPWKSAQGQRD